MKRILSFILLVMILLSVASAGMCGVAAVNDKTTVYFYLPEDFTMKNGVGRDSIVYLSLGNNTISKAMTHIGDGVFRVSVSDIDSAQSLTFYHPASQYEPFNKSYYIIEKSPSSDSGAALSDFGLESFSQFDGKMFYDVTFDKISYEQNSGSPRYYYGGKIADYFTWRIESGVYMGDKLSDATYDESTVYTTLYFESPEEFTNCSYFDDRSVTLRVWHNELSQGYFEYPTDYMGNGVYRVKLPDAQKACSVAFYHHPVDEDMYNCRSYYFIGKIDNMYNDTILCDLGVSCFSQLDGMILSGMSYDKTAHNQAFGTPRFYQGGTLCTYLEWLKEKGIVSEDATEESIPTTPDEQYVTIYFHVPDVFLFDFEEEKYDTQLYVYVWYFHEYNDYVSYPVTYMGDNLFSVTVKWGDVIEKIWLYHESDWYISESVYEIDKDDLATLIKDSQNFFDLDGKVIYNLDYDEDSFGITYDDPKWFYGGVVDSYTPQWLDEYKQSLVLSVGDANGDGDVDIKDVTAIQKYCATLIAFNEYQLDAADFNSDDEVNIKDATAIQKHIAGIAE